MFASVIGLVVPAPSIAVMKNSASAVSRPRLAMASKPGLVKVSDALSSSSSSTPVSLPLLVWPV